ncbi:MAG TPA: 50S ribosomal protein L10 [Candidatus Paceibacterota bacterium]|nr:50S ribosomal protein L10 [Candidatus Paceibacterota bacterium]
MALTKDKKVSVVEAFKGIVDSADTLVFVQFDKLTVKDANMLRRKLRASGVGYKVGKKTLMKRALAGKGYTGDIPELTGEVAIAYGKDALAPAREIYEFQKSSKDLVKIIGGIFEGSYKNQAEMMTIATIPPLHVLRGMFVNIINSPLQRMVIALDQIAQKKEA